MYKNEDGTSARARDRAPMRPECTFIWAPRWWRAHAFHHASPSQGWKSECPIIRDIPAYLFMCRNWEKVEMQRQTNELQPAVRDSLGTNPDKQWCTEMERVIQGWPKPEFEGGPEAEPNFIWALGRANGQSAPSSVSQRRLTDRWFYHPRLGQGWRSKRTFIRAMSSNPLMGRSWGGVYVQGETHEAQPAEISEIYLHCGELYPCCNLQVMPWSSHPRAQDLT